MNSTINSIPDEQSKCTCNRPLSSYDNLDTNALMLVSASSSSSPPQNHSYNSNSNANYKNITNINNSNHDDNQNILMMNIMNGINEPEKNSLNLMPPRLQTTSSSSSSSISSQLSSSLAQNRNVNNNYNTQNIANSDNLRFKVNSFNNSMTPSSPRSIAAAATTTTAGTSVSIGAALTPATATAAIAAAAGLPVLMTTAATTQKLPVAISNNINNNNDSDESKNIVFVSRHTINKPVISDAKSKFFGYNQNQNYINNSNISGCSSNSPKNSTVESGNDKTIIKLTTTTTSAAESMIEKPTAQLLTAKTLKTTSPSASSIATVGATAAFNNKSNIDCDGNTRLLENNNNNSCNKPRISLISSNCNSNTIITENLRIINCSDNSNSYCSTVCIDNEKYSKNFDQPVYQYHLHYQEHQQQQQHQQHQELRNFSSSIHNNNNNNSNCNSKAGNLKSTTNSMHETEINQPSQLVYMSTTVPQNIKGNDIAGRHTPTRNSLRHSRMLVVNKSFQGPKSQNPLGLRYPYLTKILLYLHIVFGTLLALIGFWILLWAPNTRLQDNPYWSGITLTLAGILGLIVVGFKRMRRHKLRENCFVFLKYDSYMLTLVASVLCFIALICASIHLNNITASTTKCISTNILIDNAACTCMFGLTIDTPIQSLSSPDVRKNLTQNPINGVQSQEFYYRDLSCSEVDGAWKFILTVSVLLNALGFCVTIFYIVSVFWKRSTKNFYTSVRTNAF